MLTSSEPRADGLPVYLPLNKESAAEFDSVVGSYQSLSLTVLACLHLEFRLHILNHLQQSIKQTYRLDQLLNEPDPAIISLNSALVEFDGEIQKYIPANPYRYVGSNSLFEISFSPIAILI